MDIIYWPVRSFNSRGGDRGKEDGLYDRYFSQIQVSLRSK